MHIHVCTHTFTLRYIMKTSNPYRIILFAYSISCAYRKTPTQPQKNKVRVFRCTYVYTRYMYFINNFYYYFYIIMFYSSPKEGGALLFPKHVGNEHGLLFFFFGLVLLSYMHVFSW